ncbi:MAG TPA: ATP-binding cassette domain-containing protein, partial [Verrucomicrobiae bacterium]|nr:ATP-binding cassette domain-containing protein [Verrucomicrobiae bacterium]
YDEVGDGTEFVIFGDGKLSLRAYLRRFLFTDERINTQVKYLSGGERSRLLLARILKDGGNFLILDEPTNDLDLPTLRVLEEALLAFPGCVLVVSHDRYFLNRVCTGIIAFEGSQQLVCSVGDYDYYLEKKTRQEKPAAADTRPSPAPLPKATSGQPAIKARKLSFKETQELEGMEAKITGVEEEIARIEELFATPDFHEQHGRRTNELLAEVAAAKEKLARLYTRWAELDQVRLRSS